MPHTRYVHCEEVNKLEERLRKKNKYFYVEKEVELEDVPTHCCIGRADVLTMREMGDGIDMLTYWEVKTGKEPSAYDSARKQARAFYHATGGLPAHYNRAFVYYNPRTKTIRRIKREDL